MPMNFAKTGLLLAVLTGILRGYGRPGRRADRHGHRVCRCPGMNMFSLWQSDKLVLRMYGAEEVTEQSAGNTTRIVRDLAARAAAANAARLHHEQPAAQCLRDGPQPAERRGLRLHRAA